MSLERWAAVKEHFMAALEQPREHRTAYVSQICGDDDLLRAEIQSLLAAHDNDSVVSMEEPASAVLPVLRSLEPGQRIGPYRIVRELGTGGMGAVYLATRADAEFTKHVAIKVMTRSLFGDLRRRFRTEREILARLDHPNIARLLDGGTTEDHLPFIIMEYVEGEPIDRWCRSHEPSTASRLGLFLKVCDAVQYAHRNLVVHRDLKPANILINLEGTPKLLDFGIAKMLDPTDGAETPTATEMRVMTPAYASPEQVRGLPITTVSDVYSLGVILYQLLTGVRPYEVGGSLTLEAARVVCEYRPLRPSAAVRSTALTGSSRLEQELRGDLDRIVMKALEKEPESRYASVQQFADDVERYLAGRPVLARRPTLHYRAMKFVRRNALGVGAATLAVLALLGTTIYAAHQASVAVAERRRAEQQAAMAKARFDDVRALSNSLIFELHDELQSLPGSLTLRQSLTRRGLQNLDRLASQSGDDPDLMSELALAYQKLGAVTYGVEATKRSHQRAVEIHEKLVREHPSVARYRERLAINLAWFADALKLDGDRRGELAAYERALAITEELVAAHPLNREYRLELKGLHESTGATLTALGRVREGIEHGRKALVLARALDAESPGRTDTKRGVVISLHLLGTSLIEDGNLDEALANYRQALAITLPMSQANATQNELRRDLWYIHRNIGTILSLKGQHAQAIDHLTTALQLMEALIAADPTDGGHRRGLAITHMYLGDARMRAGEQQRAREAYFRSIEAGVPLLLDDPQNQETWDDVREEFAHLRGLLMTTRDHLAVETLASRERSLYRQILASDPTNSKARRALELEPRVGQAP